MIGSSQHTFHVAKPIIFSAPRMIRTTCVVEIAVGLAPCRMLATSARVTSRARQTPGKSAGAAKKATALQRRRVRIGVVF